MANQDTIGQKVYQRLERELRSVGNWLPVLQNYADEEEPARAFAEYVLAFIDDNLSGRDKGGTPFLASALGVLERITRARVCEQHVHDDPDGVRAKSRENEQELEAAGKALRLKGETLGRIAAYEELFRITGSRLADSRDLDNNTPFFLATYLISVFCDGVKHALNADEALALWTEMGTMLRTQNIGYHCGSSIIERIKNDVLEKDPSELNASLAEVGLAIEAVRERHAEKYRTNNRFHDLAMLVRAALARSMDDGDFLYEFYRTNVELSRKRLAKKPEEGVKQSAA